MLALETEHYLILTDNTLILFYLLEAFIKSDTQVRNTLGVIHEIENFHTL